MALTAHAAAAWVLVASVIGAALLAAIDPSKPPLGWAIVGLAALLVVITGVLARVGVRRTAVTFGLLLLYFAAASSPAVIATVVGLVLFGAAVLYADRAVGLVGRPLELRANLSTSGRGK